MLYPIVFGIIAGLILVNSEQDDESGTGDALTEKPLASGSNADSPRPRTSTLKRVTVKEYVDRPRRTRKPKEQSAAVAADSALAPKGAADAAPVPEDNVSPAETVAGAEDAGKSIETPATDTE